MSTLPPPGAVCVCADGEEAFARHGRQLAEVSWQEGVENVGKEKRSEAVCSSVCLQIRRVRGCEALPHTLLGPSACMNPPLQPLRCSWSLRASNCILF